jgi:hypothetical protein
VCGGSRWKFAKLTLGANDRIVFPLGLLLCSTVACLISAVALRNHSTLADSASCIYRDD